MDTVLEAADSEVADTDLAADLEAEQVVSGHLTADNLDAAFQDGIKSFKGFSNQGSALGNNSKPPRGKQRSCLTRLPLVQLVNCGLITEAALERALD